MPAVDVRRAKTDPAYLGHLGAAPQRRRAAYLLAHSAARADFNDFPDVCDLADALKAATFMHARYFTVEQARERRNEIRAKLTAAGYATTPQEG